ncbi:Arc family DNA-binding protein [Phyllobacterium sp. 628]|uniref:Arc family DNA-binding protein n=1 Tax=Phyllobacterium sp. 628 TaxID=2718938 RepID=UPI001662597E|nr:Arc family DNA-binding protein [Phyllobacterium sp. 628]QND50824.1 Arc family DNA-binding protein [Phyllobacterium sp. 628]
MAKPGRGSDQFPLRLPDGLRDRIKARAEQRGRSMNTEIVLLLEREFPEPISFDEEIQEMIDLVEVLKDGLDDRRVNLIAVSIELLIKNILKGKVEGVDGSTVNKLRERYEHYLEDEIKNAHRNESDEE